ncbi:hypothetical protein [Micromonospora sp. C28ISP2-4]|uniref:hypothetical protein n=1 Tax=Micromonospora sp. C28ISP2-4 TaxID=3059523 RepID=UPI0026763DEF|nr:hypothetical protein [Micromonospora sp. C28ISP2-4]MDO3686246.1 hypothetical protein [Micromonospora sp. C28ISP2-4]
MSQPLPPDDTGWSVRRDVVRRSAGFPAAGLDRFAAPDCAAADALLAGDTTHRGYVSGLRLQITDPAEHLGALR